jgi:hypothetical protein
VQKLFAVGVAALVLAAEASACSCAPPDLERDLPRADGAFIGTLLERREPPPATIQASDDPVTLVFRVEQVYKGDIDTRVEVVTSRDGASCGLGTAVGERVGLLLDRERGVWRGGLCGQVDPADFLALTNVEDNVFPSVNWGGIAVGLFVLGIGGLLLVRRTRRYRRLP